MNKALWLLGGLGLGAGLIYLSDSEQEKRYRRLAQGQWRAYRRRTNDLMSQTGRSIGQQTRHWLDRMRPPIDRYGYGWRRQEAPRAPAGTFGTQSLLILGGIGLGAGLMYIFDPRAGRRRRALAYNRVRSYWHATGDYMAKTGRDVRNRTRGLVAEARTQLRGTDRPADTVLVERVRAQLGRVVSQSRAISVTADQGCITLKGPVPADEVNELLAAVESVPGVHVVVNQLEVRREPKYTAGAPNNAAE
jgi:hypothetical protein